MSRFAARLHEDGLSAVCPWPGTTTRSIWPTTTTNGACRRYDDRALYEKLILDGFQATGCRGSRSCANARISAGRSTIFSRRRSRATTPWEGPRADERCPVSSATAAKIEGTVASAKSYLKIMEDGGELRRNSTQGIRRRQAEGQPFQDHGQRAGLDAFVDQDLQGAFGARLQIRPARPSSMPSCRPPAWSTTIWSAASATTAAAGKATQSAPQSQMTAGTAGQTCVRAAKPRPASGSGCCRDAGSIFWTPRRSISKSPTSSPMVPGAGGALRTARPAARAIFSVPQHTLLVEAEMREATPRVDVRVRLAALLHDAPEYVIIGGMGSRRSRRCWASLQGGGEAAAGGDPYPLRTAAGAP